jgi:hypothetical protein
VFDDAFAHRERQVQSSVRGIPLLEVLDDAQRMQIVVEPQAVLLEAAVERTLAGVAEGRVADVVDEGEGFREIFVQPERFRDLASDLRDFHGVREARTEVVGGARGEDLGFSGKAPKSARLDNAFPVALEGGAVRVRRDGVVAQEESVVAVGDG